ENKDTDYKSGKQFHVDGTLAQHFPLFGGLAGAGVSGYYYQQVTGDSGSGATLGDFEGRTVGVGPVVSYTKKVGGHDTVFELKWLHEVETKNRLEGDIAWFKAVYKF
ncbi:MAG: protein involved in meta-pathway of phenol degradation, partial [Deltaproteobacteria bacterium]|nr:protein involved in meta-pathway of phenol degradation [Deltaproteobacteria bacterium]